MDGEFFEKWFGEVLPLLEDGSVIVMDNAPYHSRKIEKLLTTASAKAKITAWLKEKNIQFEEEMLKVESLQIAALHKASYDLYVIDEMARSQHKTVFCLPPYHCELNPIELIWATIKNYVANKNTTFKFSNLKAIFNHAIFTITPDDWNSRVQHVVQKVEPRFWELDNIIKTMVEPLIIDVNNDSASDSWSVSE